MVNDFFEGIMQIMSQQIRISKVDLMVIGGAAAVSLAKNPRARKWVSDLAEEVLLAWLKPSQVQPALPAPAPPTLVLPEPLKISPISPLWDCPAPPVETYIPEIDAALAQLVRHPSLVIIIGHRGSGKTALAERLQELLRHIAPPYAVGMPSWKGPGSLISNRSASERMLRSRWAAF